MAEREKPQLLLGKTAPVVERYAPELLYPIAREEGRGRLGVPTELPFNGADLWYAYEMSWLSADGVPVARVGRFLIPADSPNMVESKSFKLYLNSLNNHSFDTEAHAHAVITADIGAAAGAEVALQLLSPDDASLAGVVLEGCCIDSLSPAAVANHPDPELLHTTDGETAGEVLYSHLMRSLCPVTGQPDWATVRIAYRGGAIEHRALLSYILSFRNHQEFHEQCIERIFCDIWRRCSPEFLEVQGFYTRRGGLDINPYRSSAPEGRPLPRLNRQ